jgi:chorismate mutase
MQSNYFTAPNPLCLDRIRNVLTRLEDTILFQLIERAQFAYNPRMYIPGSFPELVSQGYDGTWLEWYLKEIESFHGMLRPLRLHGAHGLTSSKPRRVATQGSSPTGTASIRLY